ncbi:UNVERIFIED_CONTAM: hypothetical protein Sangu_2361200 [Sesamum angustifolium]|uniref:Uncharacterized protein n=1 Tax=Sesamum angustifolium TaxID=2727405 RepID=A0AAW2KUH2_9LAMI
MYGKLVLVYEGERLLGEVELQHQGGGVWGEEIKEIRISHYSPPSERCPPLAVLHTIKLHRNMLQIGIYCQECGLAAFSFACHLSQR